jgi:hypothetical protein
MASGSTFIVIVQYHAFFCMDIYPETYLKALIHMKTILVNKSEMLREWAIVAVKSGLDLHFWDLHDNQNIEALNSNKKFKLWQFFFLSYLFLIIHKNTD